MKLTIELLKEFGFKNDRDGLPFKIINRHHVAYYPKTKIVRIGGDNCSLSIKNIKTLDQLRAVVELGTGKKWGR